MDIIEKKRNIIVIGLGSMGKRRIRLLKNRTDIDNIFGVDTRADRREEVGNAFKIFVYESISEVLRKQVIDCAFVCTAPLSHSGIIKVCLENNLHVFTEINLVSEGYKENMKLAKKKEKVLFLSSTFFYREEIKFIQREINVQSKPVNYIYHVGQYLPDWHPWENYKDFFVNAKKTNGCREIMAIEFPWLLKTFGRIKDFRTWHDKISRLRVEYDDNFMIQLLHENGNKGTIVIDVVTPKAVRNLTVYSENMYLDWDGTPSGLQRYSRKKGISEKIELYEQVERADNYQMTIIENAYADEIEDFFAVIERGKHMDYGFEKDFVTLDWIDRIEGLT